MSYTPKHAKPRAATKNRVALTGLLTLGLSGGIAATTSAAQSASAAPAPAASATASAATSFSAVQGVRVVSVAATREGSPYRWGGNGPRAFDCSGLTKWSFARVGKSLPRTAHDQYRATRKISRSQARPGDLVFYGGSYKYHVGIYAGNGKMWHAPRTGDVVKLAKVRSSASYGRVR